MEMLDILFINTFMETDVYNLLHKQFIKKVVKTDFPVSRDKSVNAYIKGAYVPFEKYMERKK